MTHADNNIDSLRSYAREAVQVMEPQDPDRYRYAVVLEVIEEYRAFLCRVSEVQG